METKHTKGEWTIHSYWNKKIIPAISVKAGALGSIWLPYDLWINLEEEAEEISKLIAAAPDLLEALIECLEGVRELNDEYQEGWGATINKAKKAIEKATNAN